MDVKAFIFEATDKALKIDEALKGVELAKEAVEAARAAVEAAKAGVDAAKLAVTAAKEDLDIYAERAEEFGLTKSKFKDAVERMKTLLADIGAVETVSGETEAATETKPRAVRKRKAQETAESGAQQQVPAEQSETEAQSAAEATSSVESPSADQSAENTHAEPDVIIVRELVDATSRASALKAAEVGHIAFTAETKVSEAGQDESVEEAQIEAEAPAAPVVEIAAPVVEVEASEVEAAAVEAAEEHEIDNSFAEQELLDFVEELGSTDKAVPVALSAAIRVFFWYSTNVARQELRTSPSPLTLAGVLAAEGIDYLPAEIRNDYAAALVHGSEKLAAAISWYNKGIELLADAKAVPDFRFANDTSPAPAAKPVNEPAVAETAKETVEAPKEAAPAEEATDFKSLDVVIGEIPADAPEIDKIEDMDVFAADTAPVTEQVAEAVKPETAAPEAEEKKLPPFIKPSKPAWL
jgi:hypothetical protein|nr:hypothetical protein [Neorhizobium tomejilense]